MFCIGILYITVIFAAEERSFQQRTTEENAGVVTQVRSSITISRAMHRDVRTYIAHYVNGNRHVGWTRDIRWRTMREGMPIRIYYNPANPREIRSAEDILFVLFGFAFTIDRFLFAIAIFGGLIMILFAIKIGWEKLIIGKKDEYDDWVGPEENVRRAKNIELLYYLLPSFVLAVLFIVSYIFLR